MDLTTAFILFLVVLILYVNCMDHRNRRRRFRHRQRHGRRGGQQVRRRPAAVPPPLHPEDPPMLLPSKARCRPFGPGQVPPLSFYKLFPTTLDPISDSKGYAIYLRDSIKLPLSSQDKEGEEEETQKIRPGLIVQLPPDLKATVMTPPGSWFRVHANSFSNQCELVLRLSNTQKTPILLKAGTKIGILVCHYYKPCGVPLKPLACVENWPLLSANDNNQEEEQ